jgi:prepilin-type N-terminal cleavage/methylation domain-containing protein
MAAKKLSFLINNSAFTLIEMLVVVLIIGILAAIALPQYMKTIRLSRASEALTMLNAIIKGQEEYFLIYGEYTNNIEDLSITIPPAKLDGNMSDEDKKSNYSYRCWENRTCGAFISNNDYPDFEFVGLNPSFYAHGKKWCIVSSAKTIKAKAICEIMGTFSNSDVNGDYYLLK